MSTENNLFADFEALKNTGASSAGSYLASEPLSGLTDGISPRFQGLIPEPTDALFDKMWESSGSLNSSALSASGTSLSGRTEFQPLSPDAFMSPGSVLEGRGSAPIFDDVLPERNRTTYSFPQPQPTQKGVDEVAFLEQLWQSGDFSKLESNKPQKSLATEELESRSEELDRLLNSALGPQAPSSGVEVPQLLEAKVNVKKEKLEEQNNSQSEIPSLQSAAETKPEAEKSKSNAGWRLSLISALTAMIVGLFIFGWNMLPAYLVQYQVQQATGMSLKMGAVRQDYRAGITNVDSIQAFDSAQRPFFETGHTTFSSLPYFIGNNHYMNWAMVEGIRFAPTPAYVYPNSVELSKNEFNRAIKNVEKVLDDSQIDLLVKNSVSTISSPYEQTILQAQQEVKDITQQIQKLQDRLLSSGAEATDADKAQATSYQQRMQLALSKMSLEESQYNQRNTALLNNLRSKSDDSRAESNIPVLTHGDVTEYLFGQDYTEFTGQLLYEIRQFCRWLPTDLEKALGPVDKLDPSALSFRRIETQEPLAVGQLRLTGQTQFMNQTVPFSAVITNYSTKPNSKPLVLDIAFGEEQSARLRLEARRGEKRTEIMVEFVSSNVNPGTQFGQEDGFHVKLQPDEKTPFIQTRSVRFIVADGKIQGEYAMAQTAPSISIGVRGVESEANAAKLKELAQPIEKITLNGTIGGQFAKPEFKVSSNLETLGTSVLALAANEYDQRMDSYRAAIEQKSAEIIEQEQNRIAKIADSVKVSANGNALLLNQLCAGVVDAQIVVDKAPELPPLEDSLPELKEETPDADKLADSDDDLSLPSLEELTAQDSSAPTNPPEEIPFPELPVPDPEPAQTSAQIAAGDVTLDELPPLEGPDSLQPIPLELGSNDLEPAPEQTSQSAPVVTTEEVSELPALPSVEELLPAADAAANNPKAGGDSQENLFDSTLYPTVGTPSQSVEELPSLEELAPQNGIPMTAPQVNNGASDGVTININAHSVGNAPKELQTAPDNAMEINSPEANYESPEMDFWDDDNMNGSNTAAPLEEALPVEGVVYLEVVPLDAPKTGSNVTRRKTPPALPIIIDEE